MIKTSYDRAPFKDLPLQMMVTELGNEQAHCVAFTCKVSVELQQESPLLALARRVQSTGLRKVEHARRVVPTHANQAGGGSHWRIVGRATAHQNALT